MDIDNLSLRHVSFSDNDSDEEEIIVPRSQTFDNKHSKKLTLKLNQFRETNKSYCDAILEADGEQFEVHKCVLSSMSDYFDKLFNVEMKEKYEETIKLTEISAKTLKLILDFMYTSKITLNDENVYQVLHAADYLIIPDLKGFCCKYLLEDQHPSNSLKIWMAAKKFNASHLENKSGQYISDHFIEMSKEASLLELRFEEFKEVVKLKNKNVVKEETTYALIVSWVEDNLQKRKDFFPELFTMLDLEEISKHFISQRVQDQKLFVDYPTTQNKILQTLSKQVLAEDCQRFNPSSSLLVLSSSGCLSKLNIRNNFKENILWSHFFGFAGAVKVDNCIYLLGCRTSYTASNSVEKFNLNFPESGWKKSTPMPKENHSLLTSVFKNSHIFAKGSSWSAQTHVFAVKSRKWTSVPCDQNFTNTFIPTSDRIYGFPSWQYCDVPGAQWKPVAKKVENVLFGIACGSNIYLFAEDENGISLHLYDTLQETATKENTMTGTTHVKDACFVNGNIVAVVKSLNEGWLLKEYEVQKSEWRVLTGIKDEQDFNKIFSL